VHTRPSFKVAHDLPGGRVQMAAHGIQGLRYLQPFLLRCLQPPARRRLPAQVFPPAWPARHRPIPARRRWYSPSRPALRPISPPVPSPTYSFAPRRWSTRRRSWSVGPRTPRFALIEIVADPRDLYGQVLAGLIELIPHGWGDNHVIFVPDALLDVQHRGRPGIRLGTKGGIEK